METQALNGKRADNAPLPAGAPPPELEPDTGIPSPEGGKRSGGGPSGGDATPKAPKGPRGQTPKGPSPKGPTPKGADQPGPQKKRRGRPVGSTTQAKAKTPESNPLEIAQLLYGIHATLAMVVPEMMLTERECQHLAGAIVNLERAFPGMVLDPRIAAVLGLVGTAAIIYYPRVGAIRKRLKSAKPAQNSAHGDPASPTG